MPRSNARRERGVASPDSIGALLLTSRLSPAYGGRDFSVHYAHRGRVAAMDLSRFDAWVRTVRAHTGRRAALRSLAAVALGVGVTQSLPEPTDAKKKKRCRKQGKTCGGNTKCCNESGLIRCQEFPTQECRDLTGLRCCGVEGAPCDPDFGVPDRFGNCSCCTPLFCGKHKHGKFRCQAEDT